MIKYYKTVENTLIQMDTFQAGCWVNITNPSPDDLRNFATENDVNESFLMAALDEEESARIDTEDGDTLIVVDIPVQESDPGSHMLTVTTIPLAVILMNKMIITVCLREDSILQDFIVQRVKDFYTQYKTRFVLQILYRNSTKFLQYLRGIERSSNRLEEGLQRSMRNKELLEMLRLEKSLVYLSTSLRANGIVLEKLMRNPNIKNYPDDADLLEDVIIENRQAVEMANIYSSILATTTDSFASIISNNQNNVIKVLTIATIIMTIPTILSGFMGMNVALPIPEETGFFIIIGLTAALIAAAVALIRWFHLL
ncbi:magnesium transporter CorA family protein [Oscillospiraceae bacterium HV4-5-C5C]|nr:magnesium transporter CorA family protein [Oscillospiraceae bacterium HV4-5-C5C]